MSGILRPYVRAFMLCMVALFMALAVMSEPVWWVCGLSAFASFLALLRERI